MTAPSFCRIMSPRRIVWAPLLAALACKPTPSPSPTQVAMAEASASADAGAPFASAPQTPAQPGRLLDEARLEAARARVDAGDAVGGARLVEGVAVRGPADACALRYLAGRLYAQGNDPASASRLLLLAAEPACALAPYAHFRAAESWVAQAKYDDAVAEARLVPDGATVQPEAQLLLGRALDAKGDAKGADPVFAKWLKDNPKRAHWEEVALRVATTRAAAGAPASDVEEARNLALRVWIEAPASPSAVIAERMVRDLGKRMHPSPPEQLGPDDRARRAQGFADAGDNRRAIVEAQGLLSDTKLGASAHAALCRAATVRAQATPARPKGASADAWGDAIGACEGDEAQVVALYNGAKASASAARNDEALDRYTRLEQKFPTHRFADDARFRAAFVYREKGDEPKARETLLSVARDYPDGDMKTEALFRVALAQWVSGDLEGPRVLLDRIVALTPTDHHWATAGRAAYFRARLADLAGDHEGATQRYQKIIETVPLSFYMLQAAAELRLKDAPLADAALRATEKQAAAAVRETLDAPSDGFRRGTQLLAVDEVDFAKREFLAAGLTGDSATPASLTAVAQAYNAAGRWSLGHSFFRSRVQDYLDHYPSGAFRPPWEAAYPRAFGAEVEREAARYAVPRALVWAIMREESSFVPEAKSPTNALGLMQLMGETAKNTAAGTDIAFDEASLKKPATSVALGTKLLSKLRATYTHPALPIAAYNAGPGAVGRWLGTLPQDFDLWVESIPYEETRGYVKRVLASCLAYAVLYDPASLGELLAIPRKVRP